MFVVESFGLDLEERSLRPSHLSCVKLNSLNCWLTLTSIPLSNLMLLMFSLSLIVAFMSEGYVNALDLETGESGVHISSDWMFDPEKKPESLNLESNIYLSLDDVKLVGLEGPLQSSEVPRFGLGSFAVGPEPAVQPVKIFNRNYFLFLKMLDCAF